LITRIPLPIAVYISSSVKIILGASLIYRPEYGTVLVFFGFSILHSWGLGIAAIGALLITVGVLAIFGALNESRLKHHQLIALLFPHFVLVNMALVFNLYLLYQGEYDYGGERGVEKFDRHLAFLVLMLSMAIGLGYSWQVIDRYYIRWRRDV
jgi:hypothetical protein